MNCPACKHPMMALEYDAVEVDYCGACKGVWLDAGELELLFGDVAESHVAFLSGGDIAAARAEKRRRCPICRAKMTKEATHSEPPVVYDRCPRGDGLWFDQGELEQVLAHGHPHAGGERVTAFLREVFGFGQDGVRKENGT